MFYDIIMTSKEKITLMDFAKRQDHANITRIFGEECLNEDGTIMSMADQAAVITHYLKLQGTPFESTYKQKALAFMAAWEKGFEQYLFRGC